VNGIEVRDAGRGFWSVSGLATTWPHGDRGRGAYFVSDPNHGTFLERVERNAFANATSGREHVELRRNHDPEGPVFANTTNGTLKFADIDQGLLLASALSKADRASQDAVADIKAGILKGLSVGMTVAEDHWTTADDGRTSLRSITSASLFETSLVNRPANPRALLDEVRYETRGARVEYRHVPLTYRQDEPDEYDWTTCPVCGGDGQVGGTTCAGCAGLGKIPPDDDEDDDGRPEGRRDFTDREKALLGKQGKAVYIDGHWAYPTPTRSDYDNAVSALGRTPGRNRATVRKYLIRRARQEGWPIPASWQSDGSVKRIALLPNDDSEDLTWRLDIARARAAG